MKCPICGEEMQEGFLGSSSEIVWTPQTGKIKPPRTQRERSDWKEMRRCRSGGCIIMWMQNDVKNAD